MKVEEMTIYLPTDWIRAVVYHRLTTLCHDLFRGSPPLRILEWADCIGIIPQIIKHTTKVEHLQLAPYPQYDVQDGGAFHPETYDVVIADQVLEHVFYVMKAVKNCIRICKKGGIVMFGSPWVYPYHAAPKDYWRISRDAYQRMFEEFGVETIEIGGWGHQGALNFGNLTDGFLSAFACRDCGVTFRDPLPHCPHCGKPSIPNRTVVMAQGAGLFDEVNDADHAILIWAIGRKE